VATEAFAKVIGDTCGRLNIEASSLYHLAESFHDTGNEVMYNTLTKMARRIDVLSTTLHTAHGADVTAYIQGVEQGSRNVLAAALAGIEVGRGGGVHETNS
jgi:hypothetical protein